MKKFIFEVLSIATLSSVQGVNLNVLPKPYCDAKLMPYNNHSTENWYQNAEQLAWLIKSCQIKSIIEIGSWMGNSTCHMASLLPYDGKVYAVDTWQGSPNEHHDPMILSILYDQFLSNVIHSNQTHKIIPYKLDSLEAAKTLNIQADLIYLDATHEYESALKDINAWYPHLKQGGIFSGDDWGWGDRGIEKAVVEFTKANNITYHTNGWFWYFEKK